MGADTASSLSRVLRLAEMLHDVRGLDDLLELLIAQIGELPHVDTVRILVTDDTGTELIAQAGLGFERVADAADRVPVGEGFAGQVARSRKPMVIDDLSTFPLYSPTLREVGVRSVVGVPLLVGISLVGVLHIGSRHPSTLGADLVAPLVALADRVALLIDSIRSDVALRDSERRFRELFEDAPVGIGITGLQEEDLGELLMVNVAMGRLFGYPAEELVGLRVADLVSSADRPAVSRMIAALSRGSESGYTAERRILRADGTLAWVRTSVSAVVEGGNPRYAIAYVEDITDQKKAEQELSRRALTDALTGLPNRDLVIDHLTLALRSQSRSGGLVGVLYIDLDHFKRINDEHGHDVGDSTLRSVAGRLVETIRAADTPGRLGGDEFIVVCPQLTDVDELTVIANRLLYSLDNVLSSQLPGLRVSASIGAAVGGPDMAAEEIIRRADMAMYEAKRLGRRRWHVFDPVLDDISQQRRSVERLIEAAFEEGWFVLHYQPVIELATGALVGAEALVRIDHPDEGLIFPSRFIDVLEGSELGGEIETLVLSMACRAAAQWPTGRALQVAVNVSGRLASSGELSRRALAAARAAGIDPGRLVVEITERALVDSDSVVLEDLRALSKAGVTVAIDDFGVGYSSLSYLRQLPVQVVKIDQSFIAGLTNDPHDDAIVTAVLALGAALDLRVVAEGVETQRQMQTLRRMGCAHAQGFHFGRPLTREAFSGYYLT